MATATYNNFRITATYLGNKNAPWVDDQFSIYNNYNNHRVTIYNKTWKVRTSFEFWARIMNPELRTSKDLFQAFHSFLSDAISGMQGFHEFCHTFGYPDSRKVEKIWRACQVATKKARRVIGDDQDIYTLADKLDRIL